MRYGTTRVRDRQRARQRERERARERARARREEEEEEEKEDEEKENKGLKKVRERLPEEAIAQVRMVGGVSSGAYVATYSPEHDKAQHSTK